MENSKHGIAGVLLDASSRSEEELENLLEGFQEKGLELDSRAAGDGFLLSGRDASRMEQGDLIVAFSGYLLEESDVPPERLLADSYRDNGKSFAADINGSYTAAVFDSKEEILYLTTDKMGTKSAYFSCLEDGVIFSSHITPMLACSSVSSEVNRRGVVKFLVSAASPPYSQGSTLLEDVKRMNPGEILFTGGKRCRREKYWDVPAGTDDIPLHRIIDRTEEYMEEAAERHLEAHEDNPKIMLSGGLDSTFMASIFDRVSDSEVQTFTFGVTDRMLEQGRKSAEELDLLHRKIEFPPELITEEEIWSMGHPYRGMVTRRHSLLPANGIEECVSGYGSAAVFPHEYDLLLSSRARHIRHLLPVRQIARALKLSGFDRFLSSLPGVPEQLETQLDILARQSHGSAVAIGGIQNLRELRSMMAGEDQRSIDCISRTIDKRWNLEKKEFEGFNELVAYLWLKERIPSISAASMFGSVRHHPVFLYPPLASYQFRLPIDRRRRRKILRKLAEDTVPERLLERQLPDISMIRDERLHYLSNNWEEYSKLAERFLERGFLETKSAEQYLFPESFAEASRNRVGFMARVFLLERWIEAVAEREEGWEEP